LRIVRTLGADPVDMLTEIVTAHCRNEPLFLLKTVRREFQRAAILRDGAHDVFWRPRFNIRLDFEGEL
jgi:hypothetical protein